jgi:hypothetical protein
MKAVSLLLLVTAFLGAADQLRVFDYSWSVPNASEWKVSKENGEQVLHLLVPKEPPSNLPRRPSQFAIAQTPDFSSVMLEADVKPLARSVMIVYAYRDPAHFDYAHLSTDTAAKQSHHNGIFHVYEGERVRISSEDGPAAFAVKDRWYHVVLTQNGRTGAVNVDVDGKPVPALHAVDLSLTSGKVGIGSFNETGDYKNVKITGTPSHPD